MEVLDILASRGILDPNEIPGIEMEIQKNEANLEQALAQRGIRPEDVLAARGDYYGMPVKNIEGTKIPLKVLEYVPEKSSEHYKILPLGITDGVLEVGMVNPENIEARNAIQFLAAKQGMPYKLFLISEGNFDAVKRGGLSGEVGKALEELETELKKDTADEVSEEEVPDEQPIQSQTRIIEDAPVTKIVATILRYASEGTASDVHIEPLNEKVQVRFRVDGILHTSLILPIKVLNAVVARIKILSNMRLDEKRKPQDGRFSAHINDRKIDFRVSTFPTYYGEKVVMRILDSEKGVIGLDDLGLSERNLRLMKEAIAQPYGLILISGPTGSGKTTTLYSMLNEIDRKQKNVLSLEDPVEYNVPGMNQSQIRPEIGYTFANGLRTTLRQDPDVIMVGEIRDKETAALAIQASLTGHLVLSTIHTNNSVGVISRLVDMGVDPYLIGPTLILAIAQRLVKKLCPDTGRPIPVKDSVRAMVERTFSDLPPEYTKDIVVPENVYGIEPSAECPNGTQGRVAVFEVLHMTTEIEQNILKNEGENVIYASARQNGMMTLKEDALLKAFQGIVPWEEVNTL